MKKSELTTFRKKETKDLLKILIEKRKEAEGAYMDIRMGKEKNVKSNKNLRREIAQILTIINEKEIISQSK